MSVLGDTTAAVEAGDWPRALDCALVAWRARRFPELADLVDAIASRCTTTRPPHSRARRNRWWLDAAKTYEPVAAIALIDHASERMFGHDVTWKQLQERWPMGNPVVAAVIESKPWWIDRDGALVPMVNWLERFGTMLTWPPDPRLARLYTDWFVEAKIFDQVQRRVVELLADTIGALGDVRSVPRLRELAERPRGASSSVQQLQIELANRAISQIGQTRGRDAPDGLLAEARALATSCKPSAPAVEPVALDVLWRQVIERLDDVDARIVLGDALVQNGDSRGELFALQCSDDEATRAHREARAQRLIKEQWTTWLGDLAFVLTRKGSEFRRGMLEVVRVGQTSTPPWAWSKVRGHRELVAVHTVRANHVQPEDLVRFVMALPQFPRALEVNAPEAIVELVRARPRLPLVELSYAQHTSTMPNRMQWPPLEQTFTTLAGGAPDLERIEFQPIYPWHANVQIRDLVPLLPRMFPKLTKIRVASSTLRNVRDDPEALERTRLLPLVEIYEA